MDLRRSVVAGSAVAFALAVAAAFAGSAALAEPSAADESRAVAATPDRLANAPQRLAEHHEALTLAGTCEADWDDDPTGDLPCSIDDRPPRVVRVWFAPRPGDGVSEQTGLLRWAPKTSPPHIIRSV